MSNVIMGDKAILGMMRGVETARAVIAPAYGGGGSNAIVESRLRPYHSVANDAWSIIKDIKLDDPAERIGLEFIKELCERQDKLAGDSRKTAILLIAEILRLGYDAPINKLQLKVELDGLIPLIESEIDKQTTQITVNEVEAVATTASENPAIGKLLQEIYQKIGTQGIIHPEGSGTFETSYVFKNGVRFDGAGILSPEMFHTQQDRAVYEKPLILVTKKKIATDEDINPLLNEMVNSNQKDLVIFTQDMDNAVAQMLIQLHRTGRFNICIIKAPVLWQDYVFSDFAQCVGATIVEDKTGLTFKNLSLSILGSCDRIEVDETETIILGTRDITAHLTKLKEKGDADSLLRLSWLANKSAILHIGANSETDLSYKRLKIHDAIRSSQLALKYGVVKGGGVCLSVVGGNMPDTLAGELMATALQKPMAQIMENGGEVSDSVVDSAMVIKMAVKNAVSIASTILTATSLIYLPPKEDLPNKTETIF